MRLSALYSLICTGLVAYAVQVSDAEPAYSSEPLLLDIRTVEIYDSTSLQFPYELRERGKVAYSASNRTATFSEAGTISRPHEDAKIYRIGTEKHLGYSEISDSLRHPDAISDEILTLYLDTQGDIYHTSYELFQAQVAPGSFSVKLHVMSDFPGSEVILNSKSKKTSAVEDSSNETIVIEEEVEQVPQTYLQKYWIFAIPFVLLAIMGVGGESES